MSAQTKSRIRVTVVEVQPENPKSPSYIKITLKVQRDINAERTITLTDVRLQGDQFLETSCEGILEEDERTHVLPALERYFQTHADQKIDDALNDAIAVYNQRQATKTNSNQKYFYGFFLLVLAVLAILAACWYGGLFD